MIELGIRWAESTGPHGRLLEVCASDDPTREAVLFVDLDEVATDGFTVGEALAHQTGNLLLDIGVANGHVALSLIASVGVAVGRQLGAIEQILDEAAGR